MSEKEEKKGSDRAERECNWETIGNALDLHTEYKVPDCFQETNAEFVEEAFIEQYDIGPRRDKFIEMGREDATRANTRAS